MHLISRLIECWYLCRELEFHLDETSFFSFFLNFMPCHHIILHGMLINVHETPMKLSLGVVLDCLQQSTQRATQTQKRSRTVLLPTKHTLQQTTQSEDPFCVRDEAERKYASPLSATQSLAHVVVGPWRHRREAAWPTSQRR